MGGTLGAAAVAFTAYVVAYIRTGLRLFAGVHELVLKEGHILLGGENLLDALEHGAALLLHGLVVADATFVAFVAALCLEAVESGLLFDSELEAFERIGALTLCVISAITFG